MCLQLSGGRAAGRGGMRLFGYALALDARTCVRIESIPSVGGRGKGIEQAGG